MTGDEGVVDATTKVRAMDAAPVGIVLTDPSQPDNPIVYANDTFERMTGFPRDEIIGRNCRFLQGQETDDEPVAAMRDAIDRGESVTVELTNHRRDGTPFWNEVTIAPLTDGDGTIDHFVGFQSDVTSRKEAELAARRRTDELEHLIDRLNGLLYDITEALMHAQSRAATEQAICDRLIETERYSSAWVGEVSPVDGSVTPTTTAGDVGLDATEPIAPDAAPALSDALETQSLTRLKEPDRRPLGVDTNGSAAAIPIVYRRQRYGVLVVRAEAADAFDGPEAAVLEAVGRTISTAIHAAQTREGVADSSRVVATIEIGDPSFSPVALAAGSGASLDFEGAVHRGDGSTSLFFRTTAPLDALRDAVGAIDGLGSVAVVADTGDTHLVEVEEIDASTTGWLAQLGARLSSMHADGDFARLELTMAPTVDGRAVVEAIGDRFEAVDLIAYQTDDRPPASRDQLAESLTGRLTDRQHLALKRAHLSGFYEPRRQTTGNELADSMGISRSTFHQHRRAAERKLIEAILER